MRPVLLLLFLLLVPATAAPGFLGLGVEDLKEGLTITRVFPGSACAQAGVEPGQRLLALNGQNLSTSGQFAQVASQVEAGQKLTIETDRIKAEIEAGPIPSVEQLESEAEKLLTRANYKDAAAYFEYALSRYERSLSESQLAHLLARFAYCLVGLDEPLWATFRFSTAMTLAPEEPIYRYGRGIAFLMAGDHRRGLFDWKESGEVIRLRWPDRPELVPAKLLPQADLFSRLEEALGPARKVWIEKKTGDWVVVRYQVDEQGKVTYFETVAASDPDLTVATVLMGIDLKPIEGIRGAVVTELFGRPREETDLPFDPELLKRRQIELTP